MEQELYEQYLRERYLYVSIKEILEAKLTHRSWRRIRRLNDVSAISGFCEKCNNFRKRYCDGNRNTCMSILFDAIEALQAENEQLRAQVTQYREALIIANHRMPDVEAFSDTLANYRNPADVELLRKARKALHKGISALKVHCKYFDQTPEEDACIEMHEAVVEIDKAIGEEEDV